MPPKVPIDLKNRIITALTDPKTELWFPHLTPDLVRSGWQKLHQETSITEENYSTAQVSLKDTIANDFFERSILTFKGLRENKNEVTVEMLPTSIIEHYKESGVDFYNKEELLLNSKIIGCLKDAFKMIKRVPDLFSTVHYLLRSIHLIKPEDDEYDVSFSEPHIPFSIFVSIPSENNLVNALRVAEAIIHEAMHLQLTLISNVIPLVINDEKKFYSPWKSDLRTAEGVLHAIYVFQVLQSYFFRLSNCQLLSTKELDYIQQRRLLIAKQITEKKDFANNSLLTNLGSQLVCKMFKSPRRHLKNLFPYD